MLTSGEIQFLERDYRCSQVSSKYPGSNGFPQRKINYDGIYFEGNEAWRLRLLGFLE